MSKVASARLRSPDAARRLGIDGADVYRMIFVGELDGRPDEDGIVYVTEASVEAYLDRHGFGVVAGGSTGSADPGSV